MSHLALALAVVSTMPAALSTTPAALATSLPAALQAAPAPAAAAPGQAAPAYIPPGAPSTPPTEDAAAKELSNKFGAFIKCEEGRKDPLMHYCALTRLSKDPIWTPGQPVSYAGLSVFVKTGGDLKKSISEAASLAVLHLGPTSAKLQNLGAATSPDQKAMASTLQKAMAGDLKDPPVLPAPLTASWKTDVHGGRSPLKLDRLFADLTTATPTRLFRTDTLHGAVFVTVETQPDGQRFSVFPVSAGLQ